MIVRTAVATEDGWSSRVLIVADEWASLDPLKRQLEAMSGLVVHVVANASEAFFFLDDSEVDVVLVRTPLSGSDGVAVAREIRGRSPRSTVVMTGPSDDETLVAALEAGVSAYADDDDDYLNNIVEMVQGAARRR